MPRVTQLVLPATSSQPRIITTEKNMQFLLQVFLCSNPPLDVSTVDFQKVAERMNLKDKNVARIRFNQIRKQLMQSMAASEGERSTSTPSKASTTPKANTTPAQPTPTHPPTATTTATATPTTAPVTPSKPPQQQPAPAQVSTPSRPPLNFPTHTPTQAANGSSALPNVLKPTPSKVTKSSPKKGGTAQKRGGAGNAIAKVAAPVLAQAREDEESDGGY